MHALERDARTQQVTADEARLPMVQRDLALAGSTGGDTATLHQEQQAIGERLTTNRARLQEIAPREDGSPAPAARAAASTLANERLEPGLRSHRHAARISAGRGSLFARRIAGGPTDGARDELARTRAHAVRVAQTPADQRAPSAPMRPARPGSAAGKRRDTRISRPGLSSPTMQTSVEQSGEPARPSRARSSTIALLRQRRQPGGDPLSPNMPRPTQPGDGAERGRQAGAQALLRAPRRRVRPETDEE
jgi:hypothetical protein